MVGCTIVYGGAKADVHCSSLNSKTIAKLFIDWIGWSWILGGKLVALMSTIYHRQGTALTYSQPLLLLCILASRKVTSISQTRSGEGKKKEGHCFSLESVSTHTHTNIEHPLSSSAYTHTHTHTRSSPLTFHHGQQSILTTPCKRSH